MPLAPVNSPTGHSPSICLQHRVWSCLMPAPTGFAEGSCDCVAWVSMCECLGPLGGSACTEC